jgi:hypothetical protein
MNAVSGRTETQAERSRAAWQVRFPELMPQLIDAGATVPVLADGAVVDLDFGGGRLYNGDGRVHAAGQVARYLERPLRVFRREPIGGNLSSHISRHMLGSLLAECQVLGLAIDQLPAEPDYAGSTLVVLGVGLGFHLPELIRGTRAGEVILVEPFGEFLVQSWTALDWQRLFEENEARGSRFSVIIGQDPAQLVLQVLGAAARGSELCIDGGFVYVHYAAKVLLETRDRLGQSVDVLFQSFGFYEDERIMISNALANLERPGLRLIDARPAPARPEAALIIAAGPSLDRSLEHARRLARDAVVFSCGTALQSCLKQGLVPDYHCESENVVLTIDLLSHTAGQFDFSGMGLMASLTVDPRLPGFFRESLMYFREASSSTRLLAPPDVEMMFSSPTVANMALRVAVALGFTTLYLFGVDFGTRQKGRHHSSGTVYHDLDYMAAFDQSMQMDTLVPGNFGGAVSTDTTFNLARLSAGKVASSPGLTVYNCSDGALIEGARPCRPSTVRLPPLARPRERIHEEIRASCRPLNAESLAACANLSRTLAEGRHYFADLLAAIDQAGAGCQDIVGFWRVMERFVGPDSGRDGVAPLVVGTLRVLPKLASFFLFRVPDGDLRRRLFARFVAEYRTSVEIMGDDCLALLERLVAR